MYVTICHNTDLSGPADLETLELLESDSESLRSYEVHMYKWESEEYFMHTYINGQPYFVSVIQPNYIAELSL